MKHELPPLPYAYDALEPFIDAKTVEIHHDKHHQGYADKLNAALADYPELQSKSLEELITSLETIPEVIRTAVRNNAGGVINHTLYWNCMAPHAQTEVPEKLRIVLAESFGDVDTFKGQFTAAATNLFGSGWVWLVLSSAEELAADPSKRLKIVLTQGQDNPLTTGDKPLMAIDIWEHAYYLKYQNRRAEYITNWWSVLDWNKVMQHYEDLQ